jgi:tryptophanase
LTKLEFFLKTQAKNIAFVIMTITLNGGGGQPVSLKNIKSTSKLCKLYKVQFFIDGCRFAENSYFIKQREEEYQHMSIQQIALETFSMADGMTMSAKKDGICHIGGWLALKFALYNVF